MLSPRDIAHAVTRDEPALYPDERVYQLVPLKKRKRAKPTPRKQSASRRGSRAR